LEYCVSSRFAFLARAEIKEYMEIMITLCKMNVNCSLLHHINDKIYPVYYCHHH